MYSKNTTWATATYQISMRGWLGKGKVPVGSHMHLVVEDADCRLRVQDTSPLPTVPQLRLHLLSIRFLGAVEHL